ncbi:MAG: acetate/propionate family kinase [Clostridiales bacterium]|nr:acetate/propionate family kinase [Clostridiales bacterium]
MKILVSNAGSTSLKFKLFDMEGEVALCDACVERVGSADAAAFRYENLVTGKGIAREGLSVPEYTDGINLFLSAVTGELGAVRDIREVEAVGFKTVIARGFYGTHALTDEVMKALHDGARIAPAHNVPYIEAINVFKKLLPEAVMVGAFETEFHQTVPLERQIYPIPYGWYEKYGIRRYGYHGASHGYVAEAISELTGGRAEKVISCHLGGSGSLCAIDSGKSVDSTCGFSLQSGIPHASRAGDVDPYTFPFLLGEGLTVEEILAGIAKRGGLLGVSGTSGDMRDLEAAADSGDARAKLAIDMYAHAVVESIGALYAVLGGLDALVFTGGIGENSTRVRSMVCGRVRHLGIRLDDEKNASRGGARTITREDSPSEAWVIPANEELNVARRAMKLLRS